MRKPPEFFDQPPKTLSSKCRHSKQEKDSRRTLFQKIFLWTQKMQLWQPAESFRLLVRNFDAKILKIFTIQRNERTSFSANCFSGQVERKLATLLKTFARCPRKLGKFERFKIWKKIVSKSYILKCPFWTCRTQLKQFVVVLWPELWFFLSKSEMFWNTWKSFQSDHFPQIAPLDTQESLSTISAKFWSKGLKSFRSLSEKLYIQKSWKKSSFSTISFSGHVDRSLKILPKFLLKIRKNYKIKTLFQEKLYRNLLRFLLDS